MDGLNLIREAHSAGLAVLAEGERLVIRGPKRAEPVALKLIQHKLAVMAALAEAADWRARHREALSHWGALHPIDEAAALAWGELQGRWHRLHGERVPADICAACRKLIAGLPVLDMLDGARLHLETFDCLILHGKRWRGAATKALAAIGITPPAEKAAE